MQCLVSLSDGFTGYTFTTPSRSENHPRVHPSPCMHRAHSILPTALPETEPARAKLRTVRVMLNIGSLSFLLTTNLSDFIFFDVLSALQTLACPAGCLTPPTPRDAFLTSLPKAALLPRVVAALDEPQQASSILRSPVSLKGLTLGLVGGGRRSRTTDPGLSARNLTCLRAFVVAALFPTQAVRNTRSAPKCRLRSYNTRYCLTWSGTPWHRRRWPVAGMRSKRDGTQIEGRTGGIATTEAQGGSTATSCGRHVREHASCHTAVV